MNTKFKKNIIKVFICLGILLSSGAVTSYLISNAHSENQQTTMQQETLYETIMNFIDQFLYKNPESTQYKTVEPETKKSEIIIITPIAQEKTEISSAKPMEKLSRDQAYEAIRATTAKIFDPNDSELLSAHLNRVKELSKQLHQENDIKTISAIHFLLENQHRSNITDTPFWLKAAKEKEFLVAIPMTPEVANKSQFETFSTLRSKMVKSNEAKKIKDLLNQETKEQFTKQALLAA
ncbi:MAG: hypothetical protein JO129_02515 [Candidatus Dependentiae bacterium]|nr:hypothetical protein [Candidatus Dependentiae bacterium]